MKTIKLFINEYNNKYDDETLSYEAWYINENWIITNQQQWAEDTFSVWMPIYNKDNNEIWKLSIWLFKNLNYHTEENIKIPVYTWQVEWYKWETQEIKTYFQSLNNSLTK